MDLDRMKIYYHGEFKTQESIIDYKIKELDWPDGFFRKDIGYKVIDK